MRMAAEVNAPAFLRLFVAIPLPGEVRAALVRAQGRLRRTRSRVGWVAPENLHVTLAFLGDTPPPALAGLLESLARAAGAAAPFLMRVEGLGFFGSPRAPRVLWAGVTAGQAELTALQASVAAAIVGQGLRLEDRAFHAHVTLGRVRSGRGADELLPPLDAGKNELFGETRAREFELVRSELRPEGPRYTALGTFALGGKEGGCGA